MSGSSSDVPAFSPGERRWACRWAVITLFLTCLPYAFALAVAYPSRFFVGSLHLPDDSYVYLSWMREAQEGNLLFFNRFTTLPQTGGFFNLFFYLLGTLARFTSLPLIFVFHLARCLCGIGFLFHAYLLLARLLPAEKERKTAFLVLCFSGGLGFLFPRVVMQSPTDLWQAETNSFLSLYLNPLFAAALWLMVACFERLWAAHQARRIGPALVAGLLALVLANIHSYDILILWCVWFAYLGFRFLFRLPMHRIDLAGALSLAVLPLPAVWLQWHLYVSDPVFRARALVPTPSPGVQWYLLGLGLPFVLGLYALQVEGSQLEKDRRGALAFLAVWGIAGLLIPYLPFSFGRKLAMGIQIPWAILGGWGLSTLAARFTPSAARRRWVVGAALLLMIPTPLRWFYTALQNVENNWCEGLSRLFLAPEEVSALRWLSANAQGEGVLAGPLQIGGVAGYLPALGGVSTYAGHWGETPDNEAKFQETLRFYSNRLTDEDRRAFLKSAHLRYVYWSSYEKNAVTNMSGGSSAPADLSQMAGLRPVFQAGTGDSAVMLFRIE